MKDTKEVKSFKRKFIWLVSIIDAITVILTYNIMPLVQGFPPNSEDLAFQSAVLPVTHIQQYIIVFFIGITVHLLTFKFLMKDIYKYLNKYYRKENISYKEIYNVRKKCINIPYKVAIFHIFLIIGIGIIFNFIMLASAFAIIKFTLMIVAIASVIAIAILVGTQKLFYSVIMTTYNLTDKYEKNIGYRITNSKNLLLQVIPVICVIMIVVTLIGYSQTVSQEGLATANYYKAYLSSKNIKPSEVDMQSLKDILSSIPLENEDDYYYIISPNDEEIFVSKEDGSISDFVLKYRDYFFKEDSGMLYEKFESDEQLYALRLKDSDGKEWYVGYKFIVMDSDLLIYYTEIIILVIFAFSVLLLIWSRNISNNLIKTTSRLKEMAEEDYVDDSKPLPIASNDEFSDLAYYFNKIQEINKQHVQTIKNSQDLLIERERLASLGQMVGGIAHNLKTPIMSISGAAEGLSDLTKELDLSIGNSQVTDEDYHAIASDMNTWIEKIRTHTSYMSDVITAVKGQTVVFSEEQIYPFTVSELFKQVEILMRHELKNSITKLVIDNQTSDKDQIYGSINSMVQILNNMISNSIQAYNNNEEEMPINLSAKVDNNNIVISVQDFGPGLPENVKQKLFKEMITTKGKEGTGLRTIYVLLKCKSSFPWKYYF